MTAHGECVVALEVSSFPAPSVLPDGTYMSLEMVSMYHFTVADVDPRSSSR